MKKKLFNEIPLRIADFTSKLPNLGTPEMVAQVERLKNIYKKTDDTLEIFEFFINGNWQFQNKRIYGVLDKMSPQERIEFNCDCRQYEWS
jgi:hypothetical protein